MSITAFLENGKAEYRAKKKEYLQKSILFSAIAGIESLLIVIWVFERLVRFYESNCVDRLKS